MLKDPSDARMSISAIYVLLGKMLNELREERMSISVIYGKMLDDLAEARMSIRPERSADVN
eukprot:scaffold2287_cov151-Cylindrotheca_fusiformis.AAC.3